MNAERIEPLLDAAAVAKALSVSKRAVYDISVEVLPCVIIGTRSRRWRRVDVENYIRRQRHAVVNLFSAGA